MKRILCLLVSVACLAGLLPSCNDQGSPTMTVKPSDGTFVDMEQYAPTGSISVETSSQDTSSADTAAPDVLETSSASASSDEPVSSAESSSEEEKEEEEEETSSAVTSSKEETSSAAASSQEEPEDDTPQSTPSGSAPVASISTSKLNNLKNRNSDTVGWIKIAGTNIDYGVVQSSNNSYYLSRDYDKNYVKDGASIWADYECRFGSRSQLSTNTVIYGHNWTNCWRPTQIGRAKDKWFAQLAAYDNLSFAKKYPYITFMTEDGEELYWQIFSVMYVEESWNAYIYAEPANYGSFLREVQNRSIFDFDVNVGTGDKIMCLSTCTRVYGKRSDQRFVVVAKLMPRGASLDYVNVSKNTDFQGPKLY